ncbi:MULTISPECIES: hypothetical protein [Streptomyces]|uniref:Uncharacterized protein n=1 Tax=Streptomyces asoensis TaxID=249586 RepID=A0ABQ3S3C4_9ACTN|nr:hypothetical protein [Streptomyces asoensis]GGQ82708.1 hypothetical protein GCM10010496_53150 [Streptomyces asoensis]GHI62628.1 hypothetical protein Saso_42780 [Streptomyces asoensis]
MLNRLAILTVATLLPLGGGASLAMASQAAPAPLAPVTITGTVDDCDSGSSPTKVTVSTTHGSQTDAKGVKNSNEYSVTFKNIPKKGRDAKATVTCADKTKYTQEFRIDGGPDATPVTQEVNLEPE